jgi:hypothetical protein
VDIFFFGVEILLSICTYALERATHRHRRVVVVVSRENEFLSDDTVGVVGSRVGDPAVDYSEGGVLLGVDVHLGLGDLRIKVGDEVFLFEIVINE